MQPARPARTPAIIMQQLLRNKQKHAVILFMVAAGAIVGLALLSPYEPVDEIGSKSSLLILEDGPTEKPDVVVESLNTPQNSNQEEIYADSLPGTLDLAQSQSLPLAEPAQQAPTPVVESVDLSMYEGCAITPPGPQPSNLKPFWVPSYPATDEGAFMKLMELLTGSKAASKSYYAKSGAQKKCFGGGTTVTCEQIHPVVGIGPSPDTQSHKFQPQIILPIRNPVTAVPAHHQSKANMYHEVEGQASVANWREFRDSWLEATVLESWKSVLGAWKNMTNYEVGLYFAMEDFVDKTKGPALVRKLSDLLRAAGFHIALETDCAWYQAVRRFHEANDPLHSYAEDYTPSYTAHQKQFMMEELRSLAAQYPDDFDLSTLLNEYIGQIRANRVDDESSG